VVLPFVLMAMVMIPRLLPSPAPTASPVPTEPGPVAAAPAPESVSPPPPPRVPAESGEPPQQITNSIGMKLVLIPAGEFLMGSAKADDPDALDDEQPRHRVRITRPFYLGTTEVTQGQYRAVMGATPSLFKGSDDLPVDNVSWSDAVAFCDKLNAMEIGSLEGAIYRLPTEAEWEYACRAGSTTRYSFGDNAAYLGDFAWYDDNSRGKTHPVGQKRPNGFNLYDTHGNVYEWCQDGYKADYYRESPAADPPGASGASGRVIRGGGWIDNPQHARSAVRNGVALENRLRSLGFRLARARVQPDPLPPASAAPVPPRAASPPVVLAEPPKTVHAEPGLAAAAPTPVAVAPDKPAVLRPVPREPTPEPVEPPKQITNSIGMKLVLIPAGEFLMGSAKADDFSAQDDEQPRHRVRITRPFYLGTTEVTQGQYRAVTGQTPSSFKGSDDLPVDNVSWSHAVAFCDKLNDRERGSLGGAIYRLPTEAEWEYACRAGSTTLYSSGDPGYITASLDSSAWYSINSGSKTQPVGRKRPNAFNLFDMHGNVWEWSQDGYKAGYYQESPAADPPGPSGASDRVIRGGSCGRGPQEARSANRDWFTPGLRSDYLGFRIARARVQSGP
jgi:formylglycine-generating enzyme required for sulfatase activity